MDSQGRSSATTPLSKSTCRSGEADDSSVCEPYRWRRVQHKQTGSPYMYARPTPRGYHSAVVREGRMYLFGGQYQSRIFDSIFEFDFERQEWDRVIVAPGPSARINHTAVMYEDSMYVFAGSGGGGLLAGSHDYEKDDIWRFRFTSPPGNPTTTGQWTRIDASGARPCPRSSHTAVVYQESMFVFGGSEDSSDTFDGGEDVYEYHFESQRWSRVPYVGIPPCSRAIHTAVVYKRTMYIFGGYGEQAYFKDLYAFEFDTFKWARVSYSGDPPSARTEHSAVVVGDTMYVFGGFDGNVVFNDLYAYDFITHEWTTIEGGPELPYARGGHSAVVYNESMYIFGGLHGATYYGDISSIFLPSGVRETPIPDPVGRDMKVLLNDPMFSDIVFSVDGRKLFAHKNIIYCRSEYFRRMLTSGMKESKQAVIEIEGVSYEVFYAILEFLYCGLITEMTPEMAVPLLERADRYGIEELKLVCEKRIREGLTKENVSCLLAAAELYGARELRKHCMTYIVRNFETVVQTPSFKELICTEYADLIVEILTDESVAKQVRNRKRMRRT